MTEKILVEVAPGELLDKLSILEIKQERIADASKRRNVEVELAVLSETRDHALAAQPALDALYRALKAVNGDLWEIEDAIRDCERQRDFGPSFVELARSVYHRNDRRAALKRQVNELMGSRIVEEKSYSPY